MGAAAMGAALRGGETGSVTGSVRADDLIFGPDMNAAGTSIGRTYLGVRRMVPIAGTNRSLGKLLRRELTFLYGDSWWDDRIHPWVFCSFDKTLTAIWSAYHGFVGDDDSSAASGSSSVRYRWKYLMGSRSLKHYHRRWTESESGPRDKRFYVTFRNNNINNNINNKPASEVPRAVVSRIRYIRATEHMGFVQSELGFVGAAPSGRNTVVLDAICLRAKEASVISRRMQDEAEMARLSAEKRRKEEWGGDRDGAIDAEARAKRLEHLVFVLQLWTDQMLDLAYWMQQRAPIRNRGYTDGLDLDRSATLLLYPHGRRFVSLNDAPDLVPWLAYTTACQERQYWSPPGGCGGMSVSEIYTTTTTSGSSSNSPTTTSMSTSATTSSAQMGMPSLAHMVLSKSIPQPCTVRNLDQIAIRNAIDDPPVGLATMDAVHVVLMGNYEGCRIRPGFAQRMHIRVGSLVFRGATSKEVCKWMEDHYRLLHLTFKVWYVETVDQSPAFKTFISDVQHHREFAALTREASDQTRTILDTTIRCMPGCTDVSRILDDAAHMNHGESLTSFGKLRKGSFVELMCNRIKNWLRGCGRDRDLPRQYKEEIAQMVVLSKIAYSLPEYSDHMISEIEDRADDSGGRPWALGAALSDLPVSVIERFLKWDGDSTMNVSPWFADRSFFLTKPYRWIDEDTLRAIDLAAWMCARRTDGRFVLSWLRYPIGLSAETYQRLINLYFSYECCDVADNSFFANLRRILFRRRRRIISAEEYDSRIAEKDPTIVHEHTEVIKRFVPNTGEGPPTLLPVFYHILEEYGTEESRRDFAIVYEYSNRIVAYRTWSVVPLSRRITEHQIEAVKRRQTIEPWKRTDTELLGSRHLCVCGRWASEVVTPPLRPVTTSITERRTSAPDSSNSTATATAESDQSDVLTATSSSTSSNNGKGVSLYNIVPTRRIPSQSMESKPAGSIADSGGGSVSNLDASDLRTVGSSARWRESDYISRALPDKDHHQRQQGTVSASPTTTTTTKLVCGVHRPVLPEIAEPITRDVHPSASSRDIGEAHLGYDLERGMGRLVSKEHNQGPYCANQQLFRVNLLGKAIRPKGPKTPSDGPWYTLCATCGALTTVDLGRWDHRGPSCGAHGRPHRLPDRIASYDPLVDGPNVVLRTGGLGEIPHPEVAVALREDLARMNADSFLPAPEDVPRCWYDHQPCDVRPSSVPNYSDYRQQHQTPNPVATTTTTAINAMDSMIRIRYEAGTSVSTATIGSTGAALHAKNITLKGTNQTAPVRRMLIRGAVFSDLGHSLLVDRTSPIYRAPRNRSTNCEVRCGVLPSEIVPVVGQEMAIKVLDDTYRGEEDGDGNVMRLRWIYLCPVHMKDLRQGWISSHGRLVQIHKQKESAAGVEGTTMVDRIALENASSGKRIGTQAIVQHFFSRIHRLSEVRLAIENGHRARVRRDIQYGREIELPVCPDFTESRKRWSEQH